MLCCSCSSLLRELELLVYPGFVGHFVFHAEFAVAGFVEDCCLLLQSLSSGCVAVSQLLNGAPQKQFYFYFTEGIDECVVFYMNIDVSNRRKELSRILVQFMNHM